MSFYDDKIDIWTPRNQRLEKWYKQLLLDLLHKEQVNCFTLAEEFIPRAPKELEMLSKLSPFIIKKHKAKEWGSQIKLGRKKYWVYTYQYNLETIDILLAYTKEFFDFGLEYAMADVCFYKDDTLVFATIGHEQYCWFICEDDDEKINAFMQKYDYLPLHFNRD